MKVFKSKLLYTIVLFVFTILMITTIVLKFALPSGSKSGRGNMPSGFSSSDSSGFPGGGSGNFPGGFSGDFDPENFDSENMPEVFDPSNPGPGFTRPDRSGSSDSDSDSDRPSRPDKSSSDSDSDSDSKKPSRGSFTPGDGNFDPSNFGNGDFDPSNFQNGGSFPSRSSSKSSGFASVINKIWIPVAIICALVDAFCIFMLIRLSKKNSPQQINIGDEKKDASSSKNLTIQAPGEAKEDEETEDATPKRKHKLWFLIFIPVLVGAIILRMMPTGSSTSSISVNEQLVTAEAANKVITNAFLSGGTLEAESTKAYTLPGDITIDTYAVNNGDIVAKGDLIAKVDKSSVMIAISDIQELMDDLDGELKDTAEDKDYSKIKSPAAGRVMAIYAEAGTSVVDTMTKNGALVLISLDGLLKVELSGVTGLNVGDKVTVKLPDDKEETGRVASVVDGVTTVTISDDAASYEDKVSVLDSDGKNLGSGTLGINSCLKITGYQGITSKVSVSAGDSVKSDASLIELTKTEHSADYDSLMNARNKLNEQMVRLFEIYRTGEIRADRSGEISGLDESIPVDTSLKNNSMTPDTLGTKAGTAVLPADDVADPDGEEGGDNEGNDDPDEDPAQNTDPNQSTDPNQNTNPAQNTDPNGQNEDPNQNTDPNGQNADPNQNTDPNGQEADPNQNTDPNGQAADPGQNTGPNGQAADPNNQNMNPNGQNSGQFPGGQGQGSWPSSMPSGWNFPSGSRGYNYSASSIPSGYGNGTGYTTVPQTVQEDTSYKVTENTLFSIRSQDKMTIGISVDELDIRDLKAGQEVTITLDALSGQSFKGEIVSIGSEGTYDEGNTKYTVSVSVDRTEQMLSGMNAGISIDMTDNTECLTVPVAALVEKNGKTYVYTSYNEKKDLLGDLKEVTTGRSNGTDVEILTGLSGGEKVYYRYADSIEYTF